MMEYIKKRLLEIHPYDNNPRNNEESVPDVIESIKQCGYIAPIIVDENGVILAGHTRYQALNELGYTECDVVVVYDLTEEQKKKYRLYDNKTAEMASWDQRKLMEELCNVDFQGFNFGQPTDKTEEHTHTGSGVKTKACPCCGKVFEV